MKKPTVAKLKKKLQAIFNQYIRLRDCKGRGWARCISCNKMLLYPQTQAGHFWSVGAYPAVRFDERNVHVQGACCNTFKHGNLLEYCDRLIDKIGQQAYDELKRDRNLTRKYSVFDLQELIETYQAKVKELENSCI